MRKATSLLFLVALTAPLVACGGGGTSMPQTPPVTTQLAPPTTTGDPAASQTPGSTATPAASTTPAATTQSTTTAHVVWRAGDPVLGKWGVANTYQCGKPSSSSTTFAFTLNRSGTSCGRNQANPLTSSGSLFRLTAGATYTWTFNYYDGKPASTAVGMGRDTDARSLVWQIHGYQESDSPCTSLEFVNGPYNTGGPQRWGLTTCSGLVWTGPYTAGEHDTFKIVARISESSSGFTQLYRNGVLVASKSGANYHNSSGNPWWNFGPYKWRWELSGGGGSTMYQVNATISNLTLTQN